MARLRDEDDAKKEGERKERLTTALPHSAHILMESRGEYTRDCVYVCVYGCSLYSTYVICVDLKR